MGRAGRMGKQDQLYQKKEKSTGLGLGLQMVDNKGGRFYPIKGDRDWGAKKSDLLCPAEGDWDWGKRATGSA